MAKNEVAEVKQSQFVEGFTKELETISKALPADLKIQKFVLNCEYFINSEQGAIIKKHVDAYGMSGVRMGLKQSAILGLEPINHECYLIPFGSKLQFMQSYIGKMKIARKYSARPIKDFYCEHVRVGDKFKRVFKNGDWDIEHEPNPNCDPNGFDTEIIATYAVVVYEDGSKQIEVMSKAQIEAVRKASKSGNSPAWTTPIYREEMYKKTVIHRLAKKIVLDFDNPNQREAFDRDDMIIEEDTQDKPSIFSDISKKVNNEAEIPVDDVVEDAQVIDFSNIDAEMPDFLKGGE